MAGVSCAGADCAPSLSQKTHRVPSLCQKSISRLLKLLSPLPPCAHLLCRRLKLRRRLLSPPQTHRVPSPVQKNSSRCRLSLRPSRLTDASCASTLFSLLPTPFSSHLRPLPPSSSNPFSPRCLPLPISSVADIICAGDFSSRHRPIARGLPCPKNPSRCRLSLRPSRLTSVSCASILFSLLSTPFSSRLRPHPPLWNLIILIVHYWLDTSVRYWFSYFFHLLIFMVLCLQM